MPLGLRWMIWAVPSSIVLLAHTLNSEEWALLPLVFHLYIVPVVDLRNGCVSAELYSLVWHANEALAAALDFLAAMYF